MPMPLFCEVVCNPQAELVMLPTDSAHVHGTVVQLPISAQFSP